MADTITVRDHNEPCEHNWLHSHHVEGTHKRSPWCPGGREIVLRKRTMNLEPAQVGTATWYESEWEWSSSDE